eukprot:812497-Prymnesium_polylepis.1
MSWVHDRDVLTACDMGSMRFRLLRPVSRHAAAAGRRGGRARCGRSGPVWGVPHHRLGDVVMSWKFVWILYDALF